MKPAAKSLLSERRFFWQLLISVLLLVFPVCMIFFNGPRALQGIFWHVPEEVKPIMNSSLVEDNSIIRLEAPEFGIYDPENKFTGNKQLTLEQIYLSWININEHGLREKIRQVISNGRVPVITVEPWNVANEETTLLSDISLGKYDSHIDSIIKTVSSFQN